jgi:putative mRNA 3-end processing factor
MDGEAPKVRHGNGIEVEAEGVTFYLDPKKLVPDAVNCVSHAHSDHLPSVTKKGEKRAVCTEITMRCAHVRKRPIEMVSDERVRILDAGHIHGSAMFEVDAGKKVLYTGDFCTRDRPGMQGARPLKTDVMVVEATYGHPKYEFPPVEGIIRIMRDWIEDCLAQKYSVALFAYPLGKSQSLIHILEDFEPYLHSSVMESTEAVCSCGLHMRYRDYACASDDPCVMICPTGSRYAVQVDQMRKRRMRTAAVSGWALNPSYRRTMGVDEAFALSDHADYHDIMRFVRACSPELVYTTHGGGDGQDRDFDEVLAMHIKKELGIDARPLKKLPKGQTTLS